MGEIDIWLSADQMSKRYGEDADLHASMWPETAGDRDQERIWNRVMAAILDLVRLKPAPVNPRLEL